jgi:8-hydroxy-5-deazaflavin:NADPH oxidoreductase
MGTDWSKMRNTIIGKRNADEVLMRKDYATYLKRLQD